MLCFLHLALGWIVWLLPIPIRTSSDLVFVENRPLFCGQWGKMPICQLSSTSSVFDASARCKISLTLKRLFRCLYVGPMVNFFVETFYDLEILSSNMGFAVISRHSNFCNAPYFIFCAISIRLEKKFSD